jgi:hypothetical protein
MVAEGRRSKVRHPSPAQEAFEIPTPKCGAEAVRTIFLGGKGLTS